MNQSDYLQFVEIWTQACDLYGKPASDGAVNLAFAALDGYDIGDIRTALTAHVRDPDGGRFAPKPADVIRHIDGDPQSKALSAWSKAIDAIAKAGPWNSVCFDDPIIHAVIADMGGWVMFCEMTDEESKYKIHEFQKRYQGYMNRHPETFPGKLIGMTEGQNADKFPDLVPEPLLIGDHRKALAVLSGGSKRPQLIAAGDAVKLIAGYKP